LSLLDPNLRIEGGAHPFFLYASGARDRQLEVIPVVSLDRDVAYKSAVRTIIAEDKHGVCIRIHRDDLQHPSLKSDLIDLLSFLNVTPPSVDLLIDLKIADNTTPDLISFCYGLPFLAALRTFTVASGAFPKDLSRVKKNSQEQIQRLDWKNWCDQFAGTRNLMRVPSYGDYTIQHPIFSEATDNPNISASIRYTTNDYWVIMRGEGLRNEGGPGYAQYRANAQLLCKRQEFCGEVYSSGDEYIKNLSLDQAGSGCPEFLLRAGINHHMTFVVNQIANLFGTAVAGAP
jgi:hypothetical protein